jgi:hypothetical protein
VRGGPGHSDIFVSPFPDGNGKWQISSSGGLYPTWSRDGRKLFYGSPDLHIMTADYNVRGDSFEASKPRPCPGPPLLQMGRTGGFDLAPDGKRIAVLSPPDATVAQKGNVHGTVMLNFFDDLHRRVLSVK